MAQPTYPLDEQADRVDAIVDTSSGAYFKLAVGTPKAVNGAATGAAWQGVGSHLDAGAFGAGTDAVTVIGGVNGSVARHVLVDSTGRFIVAGANATGSAVLADPVLIGGSDGSGILRRMNVDGLGNIIIGEPNQPAGICYQNHILCNTVSSHLVEIMSGASKRLYIRRIRIMQSGPASTAGMLSISMKRLMTAGTSGTTITLAPNDPDDTLTASAMTLPSAKGTEGAEVADWRMWCYDSNGPLGNLWTPPAWDDGPHVKSLIANAGATNGFCFKLTGGDTMGVYVDIMVEFAEQTF
jgi:hypothetical protein